MSNARTRAVRRALIMAPISMRKIGREADVPHPTLVRIKNNDLGASEDVAEAVADVLEQWSGELGDLASGIRRANQKEGGRG